jgi:Flp pilus assembly protein TadG
MQGLSSIDAQGIDTEGKDTDVKGGHVKLSKRIKERGAAIYVTAVILVMAVPMAGLAIDGSILYILKCRLQGAVDGAALAAARSLARGSDDAAQIASAKTAAVTYTKLNFPSNYFFTSDVTIDQTADVNVDLSVAHQRTVTVTGHVVAPVLFMRYLNFTSANVNAFASAVRKDVNIVLVLDRSGSMTASGSCGPMKQAAINFLGNFAPGRDNVGVISFATSVVVQQAITTSFTQAGLTTAINGIDCQGSTSSAAALWTAYDDLVRINQSGALNFIVFFTDGEPTGVAVNMPITTTSPCSEVAQVVPPDSIPAGFPAGYTGKYITGMYATYTDNSAFIGLAKHTATANADGTPPASTLSSGASDQIVAPLSTGCWYAASWNGNWTNYNDFRGIPTQDIFGNSLVNQGYHSTSPSVTNSPPGSPDASGSYIAITDHTNGIPLATNAADDSARRIRIGTNDPVYGRGLSGVIINSIGLGNAPVPLPADGIFLERVSNDTRSPLYDSNYPAGLYVYAQHSSDISGAFGQIASEILRLAK